MTRKQELKKKITLKSLMSVKNNQWIRLISGNLEIDQKYSYNTCRFHRRIPKKEEKHLRLII